MKKVFTKLLAIVIAVMLILSACPVAFAADGDIASGTAGDGINWVIDAAGTLTISGEGEIVVGWYEPPWYDYNSSILNIVVQDGITKIPDTAFYNAKNAVTVSVPASVTNIGAYAFDGCHALQEIIIDADNENYISVDGILFSKDMTKLCHYPASKAGNSYTIPDTVTTVCEHAFESNQVLQSVIIPDTVTTLGKSVFNYACIKSVTIGNGIKTIPSTCFGYCYDLESVVISDSVEAIEYGAFWFCSSLKTVTIGKGVKTIANDAFNGCSSLTTVHYTGTTETYAAIEIAEPNDVLLGAAVHYITEDSYKEGFAAPDCVTDGHTAGIYCEDCAAYVTGSVLTAPGHDLVDGVCQNDGCDYECPHAHYDFDGICDICGTDTGLPTISVGETKTAHITEETPVNFVQFTAQESGEYILTSDNGDGYNINPYVYLLDSNGNYISYANDTTNGLNFELIFNATAGETYYFGLSAYESDVEYNYTLDKYVIFTHQPTADEPYVKLNDDTGATYQWYTAEKTDTEITDQNATAMGSSYDSEKGWSGVPFSDSDSPYMFFTVPLQAGDTVTVELTGDYKDCVGLVDFNTFEDVWLNLTESNTYELTVEKDGDYIFYTYSASGNVTVKAYGPAYTYTKINGETKATLTNTTIGERYVCVATVGDKVLTSRVFEYTYAIAHQPTSAEPYVELNEEADASYQWYKAEEAMVELTQDDVTTIDFAGTGEPTYDIENGWTGAVVSDTMIFYGTVPLNAGETIMLTSDGSATSVMMIALTDGNYQTYADFDEANTALLTAPGDGEYFIFTNANGLIRMYKSGYNYVKIDGQTAATLTGAALGTSYACEVTVGDNKVLFSDIFEYTYAITHQPTAAERYVGLNDDEGATYQWYAVEGSISEITDENATAVDDFGTGYSSYDGENGWSGSYWPDYSGADFFEINLEEGETIKIVILNGYAEDMAIVDYYDGSYVSAVPDSDNVVTLTAPATSTYILSSYCTVGTTVKAYIDNSTYTAVEGETDATLKTDVKGLYVCEVTFADGSTEMSDTVNTNYIPGDVNDDGAVNNRDYALLMQYLNKWDVTINEAAADVTGDGTINNRDYALLMQYLNKWDVELQ